MSTGTHCLTTIHTDDVRKVPDRIKNMIQDGSAADRIINDVYSFLDVAVLIKKKFHNGKIIRFVDQICVFSREEGDNVCQLLVNDGKIINREIPYEVRRKFETSNVYDPFDRTGSLPNQY
jgi:pilus assembly protein CpaF